MNTNIINHLYNTQALKFSFDNLLFHKTIKTILFSKKKKNVKEPSFLFEVFRNIENTVVVDKQ